MCPPCSLPCFWFWLVLFYLTCFCNMSHLFTFVTFCLLKLASLRGMISPAPVTCCMKWYSWSGSFYAAFCHESDTSLWQVVFAVVSYHYQLLLVLTLFQKPSPRYDFSLPKVFSRYLDGLPHILDDLSTLC